MGGGNFADIACRGLSVVWTGRSTSPPFIKQAPSTKGGCRPGEARGGRAGASELESVRGCLSSCDSQWEPATRCCGGWLVSHRVVGAGFFGDQELRGGGRESLRRTRIRGGRGGLGQDWDRKGGTHLRYTSIHSMGTDHIISSGRRLLRPPPPSCFPLGSILAKCRAG